MKTIIYNTLTARPVSNRTYEGGYIKSYPSATIPIDMVELEVIEIPEPIIDINIHKVVDLGYDVDITAKTYTKIWDIVSLTERELAIRDWVHPEYPVMLKVIDNKALKLQMGNVLAYWDDEGFPRDEKDGYIRLWCEKVLPEHHAFIASANQFLAQFDEEVYELDRPEILNHQV
jgi:hypothetical protein